MMNIKKSNLRFDLTISDKVESKIRWWCSRLPSKEWSGVLFYKYKGCFKNNSIKFTAVDFLVLDIGSNTHTEFTESPDIISYMCTNELIDCQLGLIHSHNSMKAFFSGEDSNTLASEGSVRNHFLSLIINNDGGYVATITRRVKLESPKTVITYNTFGNNEVKQSVNNAVCNEYVEMINLDIKMPSNSEEEVFAKLSKQNTQGDVITITSDEDRYPSLFGRKEYDLNKIYDIPEGDNIIQVYNHLVRGTIGKVDDESLMPFDNSLDDIACNDEEGCYNFIANVVDDKSTEELNHLLELIDNLYETPYIILVKEHIKEILEYD